MAEEKQVLVEQRSDEWFDMRRGKITSSEISKIMGAEGKLSETAKTYLLEKVSEIYGGKKSPAVGAALDWGTDLEPVAVEFYEKKFDTVVNPASFVPYGDTAGGSPDGLVGEEGIIEVKCPFTSANHFKHGLIKSADDFKKAKPEYYWQCMNNMLVTNTKWCDFVSFDPRVNANYVMFVYRLERNEDEIEQIKKRLDLAVSYMNELKAIFEGMGK